MKSALEMFPWFRNFLINPVTDWHRFINPQFNVTINQADAAVENQVLARAGSYGRQIGRLQAVMDVLLERLPPGSLSPVEQRAVDKYRDNRRQVVEAVQEHQAEGLDAGPDLDDWLDQLASLREQDPERYERFVRDLRGRLDTRRRP